jgi:glycerol-1-phosphate dehydrogenase [NAD(P)+]
VVEDKARASYRTSVPEAAKTEVGALLTRWRNCLRSGENEVEPGIQLSAEALTEIDQAWAMSFGSPYHFESHAYQEEYLEGLSRLRRLDQTVVAGQGVAPPVIERISEHALVIADPIGLNTLTQFYPDLPLDQSKAVIGEEITTQEDLHALISDLKGRGTEATVLGIGGGRTLDLIKFLGHESGSRMIGVPTSLATHVYASPKIHALPAIREYGFSQTINGTPPHIAILEIPYLDSLRTGDVRMVLAGFGDLLAFLTAPVDWQQAVHLGHDADNELVRGLISLILSWLATIEVDTSFSSWVRPYTLAQTLLCHITDWVGSPPASGSEHLFAHCAEEVCEPRALHGELVAFGALIMIVAQGDNAKQALQYLDRYRLPRSLDEIGMTRDQVVRALVATPEAGRRKARYTVVEKLNWSDKDWHSHLDRLIADGIIHA